MGNQWSATSTFSTPTDVCPEEDEPPDEPPGGRSTLKMTILDVKNFDLFSQEAILQHCGKMHTVIRVTSTFSAHIYTKPVKCQDLCNSKISCHELCDTKNSIPNLC
jgi:hypothetical protein